MTTFLSKLKHFLQADQRFKEFGDDAAGYYHLIKSNISYLTEMVNDIESSVHYELTYENDESEWGYTNGLIMVELYDSGVETYLQNPYLTYDIRLLIDDRSWGYCTCSPEMSDYNYSKKCCGEECDWTAPSIFIEKREDVTSLRFNGVARDHWKLETEWNNESSITNEELAKKEAVEQIAGIDKQIQRLLETKAEFETKL